MPWSGAQRPYAESVEDEPAQDEEPYAEARAADDRSNLKDRPQEIDHRPYRRSNLHDSRSHDARSLTFNRGPPGAPTEHVLH